MTFRLCPSSGTHNKFRTSNIVRPLWIQFFFFSEFHWTVPCLFVYNLCDRKIT